MESHQAYVHIAGQASRGEIIFPASVNGALKLQVALEDPDCHIDDAIRLISAEPLLAARIVALANSVLFNRAGNGLITGIRPAVMRVGYANMHTLVAALVVRQFGSRIVDPGLRAKAGQLWQHTVHVAALAHVLARRVTDVNPETAMFAAIVHEVGGFYLLARADEFPGLLKEGPLGWVNGAEEPITRAVLKKLSIPEPVSAAIEGLQHGLLTIPPETLLDTLLLANQLARVPSPLQLPSSMPLLPQSDSVIDFIIDNETLSSILAESEQEVDSLSAALLI